MSENEIMLNDLNARIEFLQEMEDKLFSIKLDDDAHNEVVKYYKDGTAQIRELLERMRDTVSLQIKGVQFV